MGHEGASQDPLSQTDVEALTAIRNVLDRPALHDPFDQEGNMTDFLVAMKDIVCALNTGIVCTAAGAEVTRTKPRQHLSNPNWRDKLDVVAQMVGALRSRVAVAIREGEIHVWDGGASYAFRAPSLPQQIDAMRDGIIAAVNEVLVDAHLQPLMGVRPHGWSPFPPSRRYRE